MLPRRLIVTAAVLLLAALLAGCGGGGGSTNNTPGVTLTIGADSIPQGDRSATRATLGAKLDAGATVSVYDFKTGHLIASGTTGANGTCDVTVTPGLTVAVVITGELDGKDYRLSTIIPMVPNQDAEFVADPVTSIAAEAVAQKHYRENAALDNATFEQVMEEAANYVDDHAGADYSTSGGLISGSNFGVEGSIDADALQTVVDAVPDTIDDNLVLAKNAVQQIKEAGLPLSSMLEQEAPDIEGIFAEQVADKYTVLAESIGTLMGPALVGDLCLGDDDVSIMDMETGRNYQATKDQYGTLTIADNGAGTAGQIRITYVSASPAGAYTLIGKPSGSDIELRQTFTGDAAQDYVITAPMIDGEPGANPSYSVNISLKDKNFTTPITFAGSLSAVGADFEHYTRITFDGDLNAPQVQTSGVFQANFASSLPANARPDSSAFDYPTSFSMSDARITVTGGGKTIRLSGEASATTAFVDMHENGYVEAIPKHVELNGSYTNSHSGLAFEGSIIGNWINPTTTTGPTTAKGTVALHGELTRSGHPTYYADLRFAVEGGDATCDIDLRVGASTLKGTASATLTDDGPQNPAMILTNQSGVKFTISENASEQVVGTVKVGATTVANITNPVSMLKITYTDSTFDFFPF